MYIIVIIYKIYLDILVLHVKLDIFGHQQLKHLV
jgi:hypothetical protein